MMVLPLFPEDNIRTMFDEFERRIGNADTDTRAVQIAAKVFGSAKAFG